MMAALSGGLASQASNASIAASTSTGVEEQNKIKLRLCYNGRFQQVGRLIWHNGPTRRLTAANWRCDILHPVIVGLHVSWVTRVDHRCRCRQSSVSSVSPHLHRSRIAWQVPSQNWKLFGGEYFNESISYGTKYADFMFKLSEKFKTAVSVKYLAPGEDLDPDSLISVQDDADLQVGSSEAASNSLLGLQAVCCSSSCTASTADLQAVLPQSTRCAHGGIALSRAERCKAAVLYFVL